MIFSRGILKQMDIIYCILISMFNFYCNVKGAVPRMEYCKNISHPCICEMYKSPQNHLNFPENYLFKMTCNKSISQIELSELPAKTTHLNITNSNITTLQIHYFQNLPYLEKLTMKQNRIKYIEHNAFEGLLNLVKLDLSFNEIQALDMKMFSGLPKLQRLNLGNNPFETISEGTFDALPSLKWLNLPNETLKCDCKLKWLVAWFSRNSIKVPPTSTCYSPKALKGKIIRKLKRKELHCNWPLEFHTFTLSPPTDQILFEGDTILLNCELSEPIGASREAADIKLAWQYEGSNITSLNVSTLTSNGLILTQSIKDSNYTSNTSLPNLYTIRSYVKISKLEDSQHTGKWTCLVNTSIGNASKSIYLTVISPSTKYCPVNLTVTNKGTFVWPKTLRNTAVELPCPYGSVNRTDQRLGGKEGWDGSIQLSSRKCSSNGVWEQPITKSCQYSSHTTKRLLEISLLDYGEADKFKALKDIIDTVVNGSLITDKMDLIYITNALEKILPYLSQQIKLGDLFVQIVNYIMDIPQALLINAHIQENVCSRMVSILEQVTDIMQFQVKHFTYTKNIIIENFVINPAKFDGLTCTAFFEDEDLTNKTTTNLTLAHKNTKGINIDLDELYDESEKEGEKSIHSYINYPSRDKRLSFSGGNSFWCLGTNSINSAFPKFKFAQATVQITKESLPTNTLLDILHTDKSVLSPNFEEFEPDQTAPQPKSAFSSYFKNLNTQDVQSIESGNGLKEDYLNLRIIVYKNSKLFPANFMRKPQLNPLYKKGIFPTITTPVVNVKILNVYQINFTSPITIKLQCLGRTLYDQSLSWNTDANYGYGEWIPNGCSIVGYADQMCILSCYISNNIALLQDSTLIQYQNKNNAISRKFPKTANNYSKQHDQLLPWYMYIGGCILIVCLLILAITYITFQCGILISKTLRHTLVNYWFGLSLLIFVYLFAVKLVAYPIACQFAGITLHYASLCVLFWLTLISKAIQIGASYHTCYGEYAKCESVADNKSCDDHQQYTSAFCKNCIRTHHKRYYRVHDVPLIISSSNRSTSTLKTTKNSPNNNEVELLNGGQTLGPERNYTCNKNYTNFNYYPKCSTEGQKESLFGFYLIGWGISLIICGITAAISLSNYYAVDNGYCFLVWEISLWALYFPATLLLLINLLFLFKASYYCVRITLAQHKEIDKHESFKNYLPLKFKEYHSLIGEECACYNQKRIARGQNCQDLDSRYLSSRLNDSYSCQKNSKAAINKPLNHDKCNAFPNFMPNQRSNVKPTVPINFIKYYEFNSNNNNSGSSESNGKNLSQMTANRCHHCNRTNKSLINKLDAKLGKPSTHYPLPNSYKVGLKNKDLSNKYRQNHSSETTCDDNVRVKRCNVIKERRQPCHQRAKNNDYYPTEAGKSFKRSIYKRNFVSEKRISQQPTHQKSTNNFRPQPTNILRQGTSNSCDNCYHKCKCCDCTSDYQNTSTTYEETAKWSGLPNETSSKLCSDCVNSHGTDRALTRSYGGEQSDQYPSNVNLKNVKENFKQGAPLLPPSLYYNKQLRPNSLPLKAIQDSVKSSNNSYQLNSALQTRHCALPIDGEKDMSSMIKFQLLTIMSCVLLWQIAGLAVYQKAPFTHALYLRVDGDEGGGGIRYELTTDFIAFLLSSNVLSSNLSDYRYLKYKLYNPNLLKSINEEYVIQAKNLPPAILGYYYDYYYKNIITKPSSVLKDLTSDHNLQTKYNMHQYMVSSSVMKTGAQSLASYAWTAVSIASGLLYLIYHGLSRQDLINLVRKSLNFVEIEDAMIPKTSDVDRRNVHESAHVFEEGGNHQFSNLKSTSCSKLGFLPDEKRVKIGHYNTTTKGPSHSLRHIRTKYFSLPNHIRNRVLNTNHERMQKRLNKTPDEFPCVPRNVWNLRSNLEIPSLGSVNDGVSADEPISLLSNSKTNDSNIYNSDKTYPAKKVIRTRNALWRSWLSDKPAST